MNDKTKSEFETELAEYNRANSCCIMHINTTFEELANAVSDVIDDRDYDMQSVLEDYIDYCNTDKLIISSDSWKYVRMQLSNATFEYNFVHNMYWVRSSVNFRSTDYIGLYRNKSMCAIGKISSIIISHLMMMKNLRFKRESSQKNKKHLFLMQLPNIL